MEWNVYYHNYNTNKIESYNVFNHSSFAYEVKQAIKKYKDKDTFLNQLKSELAFYFWAKCEWELILSPWVGRKEPCKVKIDVFDQVMMNWNIFANYVWENRKELLNEE